MGDPSTTPLLIVWAVILFPLLWVTLRRQSCGLVFSYCFQLWMLYWLGALIHAFPWADLEDTEHVVLGFQQATYGLAAFALGVIAAGPAFAEAMLGLGVPRKVPDGFQVEMDPSRARRYIKIGLIAYFILKPTVGRIPGLTAAVVAASQLVVTGCCLQSWMAWNKDGKAGLLRTLPQTILIPMIVLIKQGFMSYGVLALSTIMLFVAQFFRPRWIMPVGFAIAAYLGLTVYVNYARDRAEIRMVVWSAEGSSLADRLAVIWQTASTAEWFNPMDSDHLGYIDVRLNQNGLVGTAVDHLSETHEFRKGSTIVDALLGMVPRLLWPSKPVGAGSGNLVASLTGMEFATGTSVGIGPVLEFYGNFGSPAVWIGFFCLGALIGGLDLCGGIYLRLGNWPMFTTFFLVGIACLNVSGSLVEITAGAMASLVVAAMIRRRDRRDIAAPLAAEPVAG
jgi:hypothetical protein